MFVLRDGIRIGLFEYIVYTFQINLLWFGIILHCYTLSLNNSRQFQIMIIKRQSTRDVREYLQIVLNRFPDNCEIYDKITKLLKDLRLARYFLCVKH